MSFDSLSLCSTPQLKNDCIVDGLGVFGVPPPPHLGGGGGGEAKTRNTKNTI